MINALKLAEYLEKHSKILKVKYPFLKSHSQYEIAKKQMKLGGNILAIEVKGGLEAGRKFLDAIQLCSLSANLGDTRTIVTHPASTTHSKLSEEEQLSAGITPGLVRISVGLENVTDVIKDIDVVLIMSVNPGFGGQSFIENTYKKVQQLKALIEFSEADTLIEVDGGVTDQNIEQLLEAGVDAFVAGSFVFKSENPTETISDLKNLVSF